MKEPTNPITVTKSGKTYNPSEVFGLEQPYTISNGKDSIEVLPGETPIYFKRKINKVKFNPRTFQGVLELIGIKYCFGKRGITGEEVTFWKEYTE
jgi:hypothetical protein